VSPGARKGWDVLTTTSVPADFGQIGELRRNMNAFPRYRLCMIELISGEPIIWWHFAGESYLRRVSATWLIQTPEEMRKFSPDAITLIAGAGLVCDTVRNASEIVLERLAAGATGSNGAH